PVARVARRGEGDRPPIRRGAVDSRGGAQDPGWLQAGRPGLQPRGGPSPRRGLAVRLPQPRLRIRAHGGPPALRRPARDDRPQARQFEMDLYWITKGGQDPLTYFARWPGRIPLVHVKDSGGPPDHKMMDVGAGTIDWKKIFAREDQAGIRHAFVEHDQPTDAFASIKASCDYLKRLEF